MKKTKPKRSTPKKKSAKKPAAKSIKAKAKPKPKAKAKAKPKPKPTAKAARKPAAKRGATAKRRSASRSPAQNRRVSGDRWVQYVAKHGVVLASARGAVPSVAEAVAGEQIVGSWWAHTKGKEIFEALSAIDDSLDIRCFKLVDGKVTFVHRNAWPALVRLGRDGVIAPEQLAAVQQEHTPTGEHRNLVTPFPDWVDDDTDAAAEALSTDQARALLAWADG